MVRFYTTPLCIPSFEHIGSQANGRLSLSERGSLRCNTVLHSCTPHSGRGPFTGVLTWTMSEHCNEGTHDRNKNAADGAEALQPNSPPMQDHHTAVKSWHDAATFSCSATAILLPEASIKAGNTSNPNLDRGVYPTGRA